jgi:cytochrome c oxidase subunit II
MQLPFLPPQGSVNAQTVDQIFLALLLLSVFFTALVAAIIIVAAIRYRRRSREEFGRGGGGNPKLEWGGMAFLGVLSLGMFLWAGGAYINTFNPPPDAEPVFVTGRMWMWKAQHQNGQREINTLHLQVGKPYKLIMTSEDVIHDFYVPAFRIHTDVVPGRYTTQWFTPSQVGTYKLLCSQYCGTGHAFMEGEVIVMSEADYQAWSGGGGTNSVASAGAQLFQQSGCTGCHTGQPNAPGPNLNGVFGTQVQLANGQTTVANEDYIRESILNPSAKVVEGFQPIMPSYQGRLSNDEINALVAYIQSLGGQGAQGPNTQAGTAVPATSGTPASGESGSAGGAGATPAATRTPGS